MKKELLIIFSILIIQSSFGQQFTDLYGDYLGQTLPGNTAVIFAQGIVSLDNRRESRVTFSPDGQELYFQASEYENPKIYYTTCINNKWMEPVEASFSVGNNVGSPFLSADGKSLYFGKNNDIWMVKRTTGEWGEPRLLPSPINSDLYDGGYTETADGVVYVASKRPGEFGQNNDIWRIHRLPDQSLQAASLGPIVNSDSYDCDPCVAPDGSYLIFSSARPGGYGNQDLYICFNKGNNEWASPVNMEISGAKINISRHTQIAPSLSPDGKFLFFTRHNESGNPCDIYWVSIRIINKIRKEVSKNNF